MARNVTRRASDGRRSPHRRHAASVRDGNLAFLRMLQWEARSDGTAALQPPVPESRQPEPFMFEVGQRIGHSKSVIVLKQIRTYNLGIFKEVRAYLLEYKGSRLILEEPRLLDILADDSRRGREPETPHPTKLAGIPLLPAPPTPVALLTATTG